MELTSVVVIPARDEQRTIAACLEALAAQTVPAGSFETVIVLDGCVDETERVAVEAADRLGLRLRLLIGPGPAPAPPAGWEWMQRPSVCSRLAAMTG